MTSYDNFAPFYDATMGDRSDVISLIKKQIKTYHPTAKTLLELGCGTGSILIGLADDYEVSGIDMSQNMLLKAQRKLPKTRLIHADISNFSLNTKFDVIICVFDTINHLSNVKAWQKLFRHTHDHLNDDALFVFDMNTVGRMQKLAALPTWVQNIDKTVVEMEIHSVPNDAVDWHITVQETLANGAIQVHEDHARERSYPIKAVQAALTTNNFEVTATFDSFGHRPTDDADRVYFVCRRS